MRTYASFALATTLALVPLVAQADSEAPVLAQPTATTLTVYQNGLTLVDDHRRATMSTGAGVLSFDGVAQSMIAGSAQVILPSGAVVTQQSSQAPISLDGLLRAFVGKTITVVVPGPNGTSERQQVRILQAQPEVLLEREGAILTGLPGLPEFPSLPATSSVTPRLNASVVKMPSGPQDVALRYLTNGLSWNADHVVTLAPDHSTASLTTWATLTNASGTAWSNAAVAVVAGSVNQTARPMPMMKTERAMVMAAAPVADMPQQESLGGYHLYRLPEPLSLADGETRQVALLRASALPVETRYELRASVQPYARSGEIEEHPTTLLTFSAKDVKAPLPAGTVRVYGSDQQGQGRFLGEDTIPSTPESSKVRLALGEAFDITALRTQTAFRKSGENSFEASYQVVLRNDQSKPVTVAVIDRLSGEWSISKESAPHQSPDSQSARWELTVPAGGATTLTYSVRVMP